MAGQDSGYGRPTTSGMAVAGLVVAILAAITSFIPIVNNVSFFLAIISLILAVIGMVGISHGKHSGKGMAVAGIVLSVVSIVIVLATQSLYGAAIDSAIDGPQAQSSSSASTSADAGTSSSSTGASSTQQAADYSNMAVGDSVTFDDGLTVSVDSVETGLTNYDGSDITAVTVTYVNGGSSNASFNELDWKAEDANGVQRDYTFYTDAADELSYGDLSAGGTVTGTIYFDSPITKVHYYSSAISDSSAAAWVVG